MRCKCNRIMEQRLIDPRQELCNECILSIREDIKSLYIEDTDYFIDDIEEDDTDE